ncbi:MAG: ATP-binding protein [Polaromonas sp.]|nr:ATP-binding protein [Polaromonas sp.]
MRLWVQQVPPRQHSAASQVAWTPREFDGRTEEAGQESSKIPRFGIDAALLPHVFELFAQGERTPDRSQGGLGLGLSLVKSLVELHEGQVRALSKGLGQGSTFEMTLPRAEPPAQVLANDGPTLGKS